jgi:hypothetical protein
VEAREEDPPADAPAIQWRLLTTLPAENAQPACEVVRLYRLRWRIEQSFRALKTDGLGLRRRAHHPTGRCARWRAAGRRAMSPMPS